MGVDGADTGVGLQAGEEDGRRHQGGGSGSAAGERAVAAVHEDRGHRGRSDVHALPSRGQHDGELPDAGRGGR